MGMDSTTAPPLIMAQLNYLLAHSPHSIKVEQAWSGSKNPALLDRFTLAIPFCLDYIKWDVIYNAQFPLIAPDIVFGPEDEHFRPYNIAGEGGDSKSHKNCLSDWNCKDPSRLLALILELRGLYMEYQKKRVGEVDDDRLKFEISTMYSREGIEMYMSSDVNKSEEVKFAVPLLETDINKMVTGSTWRHPQKIYLQVIFPVGRKFLSAASAPRLKLVSSPELKALFSVEDFRLPSWVDGMCMAEYLPNLEEMLGSQITDAILSIEVRRKFIMALASPFGRPVEADPIFCRKATFLAVSGVFTFLDSEDTLFKDAHQVYYSQLTNLTYADSPLTKGRSVDHFFKKNAPGHYKVHFSLPLQFPRLPPTLVLQSSQHFNSLGAPIKSHPLQDFPWSPRWEASEMAERLFDHLADECVNFKKCCNEAIGQQR